MKDNIVEKNKQRGTKVDLGAGHTQFGVSRASVTKEVVSASYLSSLNGSVLDAVTSEKGYKISGGYSFGRVEETADGCIVIGANTQARVFVICDEINSISDLNGDIGYVLQGPTGSKFGFGVVAFGNNFIAVSSPDEDTATGAVRVFYNHSTVPSVVLHGPGANTWFAHGMESYGDHTLALGCPCNSTIYIVDLANLQGNNIFLSNYTGTGIIKIKGNSTYSAIGYGLSICDIDGDGKQDLIFSDGKDGVFVLPAAPSGTPFDKQLADGYRMSGLITGKNDFWLQTGGNMGCVGHIRGMATESLLISSSGSNKGVLVTGIPDKANWVTGGMNLTAGGENITIIHGETDGGAWCCIPTNGGVKIDGTGKLYMNLQDSHATNLGKVGAGRYYLVGEDFYFEANGTQGKNVYLNDTAVTKFYGVDENEYFGSGARGVSGFGVGGNSLVVSSYGGGYLFVVNGYDSYALDLVANSITSSLNSNSTLSTENLNFYDPVQTPSQLSINVTESQNCKFMNSGSDVTIFTKQDIADGLISVLCNENTNLVFNATVSDGTNIVSFWPNILLLTKNSLASLQNKEVAITAENINATDAAGRSASTIDFLINNLQHGTFLNNGTASTNFTLQNIVDNQIKFRHDGSGLAPVYDVAVSDRVTSSAWQAANITFTNNAPTVVTPLLTKTSCTNARIGYAYNCSFADTFFDADGDVPNYSVSFANGSALSSWFVFDQETKTLLGDFKNATEQLGSYEIKISAKDPGNLTASAPFTAQIEQSLVATIKNETKQICYTAGQDYSFGSEDTSLVITTPSANVTAKLTINDPASGVFSLGSSGSVISSYDASTGTWRASGAKGDVNKLLSELMFTPRDDYAKNFSVRYDVNDTYQQQVGFVRSVLGARADTGNSDELTPNLWGRVSNTFKNDPITAWSTLSGIIALLFTIIGGFFKLMRAISNKKQEKNAKKDTDGSVQNIENEDRKSSSESTNSIKNTRISVVSADNESGNENMKSERSNISTRKGRASTVESIDKKPNSKQGNRYSVSSNTSAMYSPGTTKNNKNRDGQKSDDPEMRMNPLNDYTVGKR